MAEYKQTDELDGLYFCFDSQKIKNVFFDFAFVNAVAIEGDEFSVETRGTVNDNFICYLREDGTLIIKNESPIEQFNFVNHDRTRVFPRVLLTIPKDFAFESFRLKMNAGSFSSECSSLKCVRGSVKTNAGQIKIAKLNGGNIDFSCGAGSIVFNGTLTEKSKVDCGAGNITLNIKGNKEEYSCDTKTGLGAVKLNETLLSTFGHSYADKIAKNHISVNCALGNVSINVHTF